MRTLSLLPNTYIHTTGPGLKVTEHKKDRRRRHHYV